MGLFGRVDGELRRNLREALCELFLGDLLKLLINLKIGVEQLVAFGGQRRAMGAVAVEQLDAERRLSLLDDAPCLAVGHLHALGGGVQGALAEGATVSNNTFNGTLTLGGSCKNPAVGGLYGKVLSDRSFDNATDKSVTLGTIKVNAFYNNAATCVYAGGFVGLAEKGVNLSFKGYEAQSNIILDAASATMTAAYICIGGFLGGNAPDGAAASLEFDNLISSGVIETQVATATTCTVRRIWVGGVAGFANGPSVFKDCINKGEVGKIADKMGKINAI